MLTLVALTPVTLDLQLTVMFAGPDSPAPPESATWPYPPGVTVTSLLSSSNPLAFSEHVTFAAGDPPASVALAEIT